MAVTQADIEVFYNPSSLLNIFINSLTNDALKKIFRIKGIYLAGNGINYRGMYFDSLKDEATDACITLVVPALIRSQLAHEQIIECSAYLTKKVQLNGARIALQVNVVELFSQKQSSFTPDQLKAFEILQKKAEAGYKDVDGFIKSKLINGEAINVNVLIGKAGIIDSDIKQQLQEAITFYKIYFIRINLTSPKEIIESLNFYHKKCDILVLARGGGDNLEIFDKPEIAEASLGLASYFITAIGHANDVPLLEKIADKAFITPTSLGQYLKDVYNHTKEQLENSKAKLIDSVKKQLDANYGQQLQNLNEKLLSNQELNKKELTLLNQHLEKERQEKDQYSKQVLELKEKMNEQKPIPVYFWILLIVVLIIGWLAGRFLIHLS